MKNTLYSIAFLSVLLLFGACAGQEEKASEKSASPVNVDIRTVVGITGQGFLSASGTIQAVNSANLSTRMMGYVEDIRVDIGDKVRKGQLLLTVNDADLDAKKAQVKAGIREAETAFNNAKKDYERFQNLFRDNSASQKEMDDITAHYNMAEARLESAREMMKEVDAQMAYTRIKAPFNGIVSAKFVKSGDMANPGQPLLAMEGEGDLEVVTRVPESEISNIEKNQSVEVQVRSVNHVVKGKVRELSSSARNTGGQYVVKIQLENPDPKVLPGMYATVQFPTMTTAGSDGIRVPKSALVQNGQLKGIYTLSQSNTAILRWLRLGREYGEEVEVLSGLSVGESYIIPGETKLYNGIAVTTNKKD